MPSPRYSYFVVRQVALDGVEQFVEVERFEEEVAEAALLEAVEVALAVRTEDDHGGVARQIADALEDRPAPGLRVGRRGAERVGQDQIEAGVGQGVDRLLEIGRDSDPVALRAEGFLHHLEYRRVILNDQQRAAPFPGTQCPLSLLSSARPARSGRAAPVQPPVWLVRRIIRRRVEKVNQSDIGSAA